MAHEPEMPAVRTIEPAAPTRRVAVIGGGLAGTTCARRLRDAGLDLTIFDKGRGPGGRMSTRRNGEAEFDHGAQYFTARHAAFRLHVSRWRVDGVVAPWPARIWRFGPTCDCGQVRDRRWYVGLPSMSAILRHDQAGLDVQFNTRIVRIERTSSQWYLFDEAQREFGPYAQLVIAIPAPQAQVLLQPITPEIASVLDGIGFAPCWAGLLRFAESTGAPFDAATVEHGPLAWIARNSSKPARGGPETWILHAASLWSLDHLEREKDEVIRELSAAFSALLDKPCRPVWKTAHRWRYARAIQPLGRPCMFDPARRLGLCGDWCIAGRMEAAFDSGRALAQSMLVAAPCE